MRVDILRIQYIYPNWKTKQQIKKIPQKCHKFKLVIILVPIFLHKQLTSLGTFRRNSKYWKEYRNDFWRNEFMAPNWTIATINPKLMTILINAVLLKGHSNYLMNYIDFQIKNSEIIKTVNTKSNFSHFKMSCIKVPTYVVFLVTYFVCAIRHIIRLWIMRVIYMKRDNIKK